MIVSEADRHRLHSRLIEALGQDVADTLMEHLPPSGWADVATKRDLDLLRAELRGEIAELRGEMALFRGDMRMEMANLLRAVVLSVAGMMLATIGSVAALIH